MDLKTYLAKKKITITQAASELGITRPYLSDIVNLKRRPHRKTAEAIESWTGGAVSAIRIIFPNKIKKLSR